MYSASPSSSSRSIFALMFTIFLLLNLNFTLLRTLRNTLAVVDLGSGAHSIPFFELFGAMPGAFLMTWALAAMLSRFSIEKVFLATLSFFLIFFALFTFGLYPFLAALKGQDGSAAILNTSSLIFYVLSELWKPALGIVLFWGLINQNIPVLEAKKLYAPLMLGGSLGSVVAGPIISFCTSETVWKTFSFNIEKWAHALTLLTIVLVVVGAVIGILYYKLWRSFSLYRDKEAVSKESSQGYDDVSIKSSLLSCFKNEQLRLLAWIVIADYIAYSLGEVIFLDILKVRFPAPADYCNYMGSLALWSGLLTVVSSLSLTPYILLHCRWVVASIITPFCLLLTGGLFFLFICGKPFSSYYLGWSDGEWIQAVTLFGSLQYCLCRAAKYTLFDASKELAFVLMPAVERMKGKLVVDGLCARVGRGGASALSIYLINFFGGVLASAFATGVIATAVTVSWIISSLKLGRSIEQKPFKSDAEPLIESL